jgi:hypothetical protein
MGIVNHYTVAMRGDEKPDALLEKLLTRIGSEFELEEVPVRAEPYATPQNCFLNVEEKVRRDGGKVHYGWLIHETTLLYEAERHAVWEDDEEELVDVTPYEPDEERVRFVSDNKWVYAGKSVDNIRVNKTKNKLVDDVILVAEAAARAEAYGEYSGGSLHIPEAAAQVARFYEEFKQDLLSFIKRGGKEHFPCFCGRGKSYRNCHGRQLRETTNEVLEKLRSVLSKTDD